MNRMIFDLFSISELVYYFIFFDFYFGLDI